ncbi:hypothetical protein SLA2020_144870 [Shorea laevis]
MGKSFNQWDVGERNARLDELAELHKLTALEVRIPNFRAILFPENLRRFKIFLGEVWYSWDGSFESSKRMKLKLQGASIKSDDSVKKLLKETEDLYLEGLNGVENLVCELDDEGFRHLKCLNVENAPDIRCIFNPAGRLLPSHLFPTLEVFFYLIPCFFSNTPLPISPPLARLSLPPPSPSPPFPSHSPLAPPPRLASPSQSPAPSPYSFLLELRPLLFTPYSLPIWPNRRREYAPWLNSRAASSTFLKY